MKRPRRLALAYLLPLAAFGQTEILRTAAAAFDANAGRSANFEWTQTVRVAILNGAGREYPGDGFWVRTQSTRLDDGRRCDVVEQWSDAVPVADSALPLERRCELEAPPLDRDFAMRAVLRYGTVSSMTRTGSDYTVAFSGAPAKRTPSDAMARCGGTIRAVLVIDSATSFPKSLSGTVPGNECQVQYTDDGHKDLYGRAAARGEPGTAGYRKGTRFVLEYRAAAPNAEKVFWYRTLERLTYPMGDTAGKEIFGRRMFFRHTGGGNLMFVETTAAAKQYKSDTSLSFGDAAPAEPPKLR